MICKAQDDFVQIHYLGHASFIITLNNKISILTDYGKPNAYLEYGWNSPVYSIGSLQPTLVTYSHRHNDHYDSARIPQNVQIVINFNDSMHYGDLIVIPIPVAEKDYSIFDNFSYLFEYKGLKILHLGDCQANIINIDTISNRKYLTDHIPEACDILLMPIESTSKFIPQAWQFIDLFHPKVVIPMHYWSEEYKMEFIDFVNHKPSKEKGSAYKFIDIDTGNYKYSMAQDTNTISIILMTPSEFK
jgi:L-ascorbate metabolism protein UlaG (beta-lactamase superfamily)